MVLFLFLYTKVQLPSSILQGPENPKDISLTKSDKLVQPEMIFPASNGRRFSCKFYEKYNWIDYSVSNYALFCFNINSLLLESEFQSAKVLIQNSNTNQSNNDIFSISKILNKIPNAFPETLKIITSS